MSDYRPGGMNIWDLWFAVQNEKIHMFYQQGLSPDSDRNPDHANYIGHAVSTDLINWIEHPLSLGPGAEGGLEDMWPWTGCAVMFHNVCFMYYTMRSSREKGKLERIGLATSRDFENWERWLENPVIRCDEKWYYGASDFKKTKRIDCRDLIVVEDSVNGGWIGFYAARIPAGEQAQTAVIGCARSNDLIQWDALAPAFAPQKYGTIEVPDVFQLNGKWYMTCYTGTAHGNRGVFSDPNVLRGSIYAVSDNVEGPYHEIEGDNVYGAAAPFLNSIRTVEIDGTRYALSTLDMSDGTSTVTLPSIVNTLPDGRLRMFYNPMTESLRKGTLISPDNPPEIGKQPLPIAQWSNFPGGKWFSGNGVYFGESKTGWQTADLGTGSRDVEIEAVVEIESGIAGGLVYRPDKSDPGTDQDIVIMLDAEKQEVSVVKTPVFREIYTRKYPVKTGQPYHVRVNIRYPRIDVFIDDILTVQCAVNISPVTKPSIGLFVDRAKVAVKNISAYKLA